MLKVLLLLFPIAYALVTFNLSARQASRRIGRNSSPLRNPNILKLIDRLGSAANERELTAQVYEISPVNGLAMPDGKIYITRGLLKRHDSGEVSAEELVSVVAHELGHVKLGHTRNRLADFAGQNVARVALSFLLNRFLPGIGALVVNFLIMLFASRMSQVDELSADEFASAILTKSRIGTSAQKSMLRKLERMSGVTESEIAWLTSHPRITRRIEEIERREVRWGTATRKTEA